MHLIVVLHRLPVTLAFKLSESEHNVTDVTQRLGLFEYWPTLVGGVKRLWLGVYAYWVTIHVSKFIFIGCNISEQ